MSGPVHSHCIDRAVLDDTAIPDFPHVVISMSVPSLLEVVVERTVKERELLPDLVLRAGFAMSAQY